MAKTKKLLCLAVAIALVSSLIAMPASAEVTTSASVTFEGGTRPSYVTSNSHNLVTGAYGKAEDDYSANVVGTSDKYFSVRPGITVPTAGKLKISYDIASNDFTGLTEFQRYFSLKINGAYRHLLKPNNVTFDNMVNGIYNNLNEYVWNNVTAILEFTAENATANYTLYINGKQVYNNATFNKYAPWSTIDDIRVGGILVDGDALYYDNILIETYTSDEITSPSATFTSSATSTDSSVVIDNTNKKVRIADDMSVATFTEKTTNFVLLDATGNAIAEETLLTDASVKLYAKYVNGINMYYEPYTVEIIPPVITGSNTTYQEIINNDTKEIRVVDMPELTVGSFKDNITNTGVLAITKNGEEANDSELLKDCTVRLTLGTTYDYTYTVVTARSYTIENETFENGTFTTRTSGHGPIYSGNGFTWTGNTNGISGITFDRLNGLGGKDGSSLGITINNAGAKKEVFAYINNPYITGSKVITTTHTLETKIYLNDVDTTDFSAIDLCVDGRNLLKFFPDGSIKHTDGTVDSGLKWEAGKWVPIAVTYHKATNIIDVYVGGEKVTCTWKPAPNGTDIRFRPWVEAGASFTMAIDDVKFYTDSLEKVKYTVTGSAVTAAATESLNCVPVIALYGSDDSFLGATIGKTSKTISKAYAQGQKVKVLLLESLEKIKPITKAYPAV